uniref:Uncharacterized protein n=1 Tax=Anguilla anguilla TaxID=7936 RepID=A0A0E9RDK3_ANGAN
MIEETLRSSLLRVVRAAESQECGDF